MNTERISRRHRPLVTAVAIMLALTATGCSQANPPASAPTQVRTSSPSSVPSTSTPAAPTSSPASSPTTSAPTTPQPAPTTTTPRPAPAPVIRLRAGQSSPKVRELQARLRQIRWYSGDVTNYYGTRTTAAVRGFQAKRGFPATGMLDERTWDRLLSMTRRPTADELNNVEPKPVTKPASGMRWDVDSRCLTGRVICISKSTRMLTWVIDGVPQYQFDVRFGSEALPTREGTFAITWKKKDVISTIYHTPMPYSMFFSGGQAIHYSSNFARLGYNGSSHGCVNVRDWDGIVRLYNDAPVGTKVVIHW